jgi:glutamyl-Q tRNA(Asp) synthetase
MGSLVTALASYLDIKTRGGRWYVRIDDLDPPRQDPNATRAILTSLTAHGLISDLAIDYQSQHQQRYTHALESLVDQLFYCTCTRKSLAHHRVYPGTCRAHTEPKNNAAVRLRVDQRTLIVADLIAGEHSYNLLDDYGDFIVKRRDGLWAYNFATAVDDGFDVTHVLRGQDLFHVTPQQAYLIDLLSSRYPDVAVPTFIHIPVLCFADGTKLSKQAHAPPLDDQRAPGNLRAALLYLGFAPPLQEQWQTHEWLAWGLEHWDLSRIPKRLRNYEKAL